jgi:hypothetical protein
MPIDRTEPLSRYRIIRRHGGGQAAIEYADERADALSHQAEVGGEVEAYVYGIGWQPITKVAEASE